MDRRKGTASSGKVMKYLQTPELQAKWHVETVSGMKTAHRNVLENLTYTKA